MITRIELRGYKRFSLNQFEVLEIDFTASAQVILGTNGSGKSSLLEQLSPLPAVPSDFAKNGYKVIHLQANHKIYKLSSKFGTPHPHSFLVDDEELNEGGTITVQRELVKQHFGYTQELHHLLLGRETFDKMSPARRKDVFVKLNDEDYDYAIKVYNTLKDKLRDVSGAIKIAKNTLAAESEKLILEDEEKALVEETRVLTDFLNALMEARKPVERTFEQLDDRDNSLEHQILSQSKMLSDLWDKCEGITTSIGEYGALIDAEQAKYLRESGRIEQLDKELSKVQEKIGILQQSEARSVEELDRKIAEASSRVSQVQAQLLLPDLTPANAQYESIAFEELHGQLAQLFADLPVNPNKRYSQTALQQSRERAAELARIRSLSAERLLVVTTQINHQEKHRDNPDLECPKCSHSFSTVFKESTYATLKAERQELIAKLAEHDAQIKANQDFIDACTAYGAGFRQFHQITQAHPGLSDYWEHLRECGCLSDSPDKALYILNSMRSDLALWVEMQALSLEIVEKTELRRNLAAVGSADLASLIQHRDDLNRQMSESAHEASLAQAHKQILQTEQTRLKQIGSVRDKLSALLASRKDSQRERMETIRRSAYNEMIRQVRNTLSTKEQLLGNISLQKNLVQNLAGQVETLSLREKDLSILVKRMSPTEGLIAEGLFGFIKNFVDRMNAFISRVWTYSMEVQSCGFLDGVTVDLDWKFPMMVEGHESPIPDVSCGSTGQVEMINLAFKVTAMSYLPQRDLPLFLDEFGRTLDASHKTSAMHVVRNIIEEGTFPQVFLISHDFHQYGSLINSQFTMLNSLNVAPPAGVAVNAHVRMA